MKTTFFSRIHWKSFFLGVAIAFLIMLILEWDDVKEGWNDAKQEIEDKK